jgi:DNA repair protein RadC
MENLIIAKAFDLLTSRLRESTISLSNADLVERYLLHKLILEEREVFGALWPDVKNRLIACEDIAQGTIANVIVFPREVVKSALRHNAAGAIFYHNHPSGDPTPSLEDKKMTSDLKRVLKLVDVCLRDHFIVAGAKTFSFLRHRKL